MTYFGFLARFVCIPILLLGIVIWVSLRRGAQLPKLFQTWPAKWVILGHIVVAFTYTTPWDNYLVATNVWWYDPELVSGIVLWYVPLEEYTFFILQTILTGLWVVWLMMMLRPQIEQTSFQPNPSMRWGLTAVTAIIWLISTVVFFSGWEPANYLTLILSWALIPVLIQFAFGGDILWHYRRLVLLGLAVPALYLSAADAVAILAGTWTISPEQTLGWLIGGILPFEEFLFFLVTNVLVTFGVTLVMARISHERAAKFMPQGLVVEGA